MGVSCRSVPRARRGEPPHGGHVGMAGERRRRPLGSSAGEEETTRGLAQRSRPSSKPVAVAVFAPDPCRGWGRYPSACIRTQKEPVVSPADSGRDYRSTRGVSWRLAAHQAVQGARRPLGGNGRHWKQNVPLGGTCEESTFSSDRQGVSVRTGTLCRRGWRAWVPRGLRGGRIEGDAMEFDGAVRI